MKDPSRRDGVILFHPHRYFSSNGVEERICIRHGVMLRFTPKLATRNIGVIDTIRCNYIAPAHTVPYGTDPLFTRFLAMNCQASAPWKRTSQQMKVLHC